MSRRLLTMTTLLAVTTAAHADVWMVKGSNAVACLDRQALIDLDGSQSAPGSALPAGCLGLYSGERLLEQTELGGGFNRYLKVERSDGSIVFVRAAEVVADPGIGSVSEDRANR